MSASVVAPPASTAELLRRIREVRKRVAAVRRGGGTVALVPTMGSLHEGHLSLADGARASADWVVLSVFVNPLQFGAGEDLDRYPRDLAGDLNLASGRGVDAVFAPSVGEMYPAGAPRVTVDPGPGAEALCGASRPGHFRGVLTVVAKLFAIVAPDVALFGQKDFQQARLIRRMATDLDFAVRIEVLPTVREPDGLALSSRNRYLSPDERIRALALSAALRRATEAFRAGEADAERLRRAMRETMGPAGADVEYAEVVDPDTLTPLARAAPGAVCVVAARLGGVRLIDNAILGSPDPLPGME